MFISVNKLLSNIINKYFNTLFILENIENQIYKYEYIGSNDSHIIDDHNDKHSINEKINEIEFEYHHFFSYNDKEYNNCIIYINKKIAVYTFQAFSNHGFSNHGSNNINIYLDNTTSEFINDNNLLKYKNSSNEYDFYNIKLGDLSNIPPNYFDNIILENIELTDGFSFDNKIICKSLYFDVNNILNNMIVLSLELKDLDKFNNIPLIVTYNSYYKNNDNHNIIEKIEKNNNLLNKYLLISMSMSTKQINMIKDYLNKRYRDNIITYEKDNILCLYNKNHLLFDVNIIGKTDISDFSNDFLWEYIKLISNKGKSAKK